MKDEDKTKEQLLNELVELRQNLAVRKTLEKRRKHSEQTLRKNERLLQSIINSIQDGINLLDNNMNIIAVNHAMEQWYPHLLPLVGKKCFRVFHGRSEPCETCPSIRAFQQRSVQMDEKMTINSAGIEEWFELYAFPVFDDKSNVTGVIKYLRNISQRKKVEEALREQREWFQVTLSSIGDGVIATDTKGFVTFINHVAEELTGYSEAEAIGKPIDQVFHIINEATGIASQIPINRVLHDEVVVGLANHTTLLSGNGTEYPIADAAAPIRNYNGKIIGVVMVFHDITERKQAEERIRESEERFKNIYSQSPIGIELYDANGHLIDANRACLDIFGISDFGEVKGFNLFEDPNLKDEYKKQLLSGHKVRYEVEFDFDIVEQRELYNTTKQGICYLDCVITPLRTELDTCSGYLVQVQDINHRKMAEIQLQESKERYRQLVELSPDAVFVHSEGRIIFANPAAAKLLHLSSPMELIGKPTVDYVNQFVHPAYQSIVKERIWLIAEEGKAVPLQEEKHICADMEVLYVETAGALITWRDKPAVQIVIRDISDRKKLEEGLLQASKLEAIGILAGGIAHDFNNILTVILGNASLARLHLENDQKTRIIRNLTEIEKAVQQAKSLTKQLLTFSKGGAPIKKKVSIGDLIRESTLFALSGSNVECEFSISAQLWPVEIDEGQINQVINNLIINAVQAMPEGGTIRMKTDNYTAGVACLVPPKAGHYVKISIEDEGVGIPQKYLQKIFDPYFTTKQGGSGLGLATSYSIIKKHDGYIAVESEVEVGTTFHIYLPVAILSKDLTMPQGEKVFFYGKGKILLMDDEEDIRNIAGEILSHLGYEVELAKNGTEGIELYKKAKESGHRFDLVIMDLTVPGNIGGREAIKKMREIDPDLKAIVSSGYSNDQVIADYTQHGFSGFVAKPYKLDELSEVVHKVVMGEN